MLLRRALRIPPSSPRIFDLHRRRISIMSTATVIHPSVDLSKLNPAIKAFCDKLNALPPVDPSKVPALVRRGMFQAFALGSSGESDFIPRIDDHMAELGSEGGSSNKRHIRLYYPSIPSSSATSPLPVYLAMHGGGWHAGSIFTHDNPFRRLAIHSGCVVASLDYRMSPEHPAPAGLEDCVAAFRWLQNNAASLGVDAAKVGLLGDSAGGNLAAASALLLCNGRAVDNSPLVPALTHKPASLVLIYPALDLTASSGPSYETFANGFYLRTESIHHYVHLYLEGDSTTPKENLPKGGSLAPTDPRVSPLFAAAEDLEALPHTFISTAGYDPLLSDGEVFYKRLQGSIGATSNDKKKAKVVEYSCEEDSIHAWIALTVQAGDVIAPKMVRIGEKMKELIMKE